MAANARVYIDPATGISIMTGVDTPTATGVDLPIGSLYTKSTDGAGYLKTGVGDTAWTLLSTGSSGLTQAQGDARYLQLTGGTISGATEFNVRPTVAGVGILRLTEGAAGVSLWDGTSQVAAPRSFAGNTRSSIDAPNTYAKGIWWQFKDTTAIPTAGGNYRGLLTLAPFDSLAASTGDPSYQLAFLPSAANAVAAPILQMRAGIDTTWGAWQRVVFATGNPGLTIGSQTAGAHALNVYGDMYTSGYVRLGTAGVGLYSEAHIVYFTPASYGWILRTNTTTPQLEIKNSANTTLGSLYGDASGFGLLTTTGGWAYRIDPGTTNAETFGNLKVKGDLYTYRSAGTSGVLFLNSASNRYLYYDTARYELSGAPLFVSDAYGFMIGENAGYNRIRYGSPAGAFSFLNSANGYAAIQAGGIVANGDFQAWANGVTAWVRPTTAGATSYFAVYNSAGNQRQGYVGCGNTTDGTAGAHMYLYSDYGHAVFGGVNGAIMLGPTLYPNSNGASLGTAGQRWVFYATSGNFTGNVTAPDFVLA